MPKSLNYPPKPTGFNMPEPKFKPGFRVEILSRRRNGQRANWENTAVGTEAIIESVCVDTAGCYSDYATSGALYKIFILHKNREPRSLHWFEEENLELICKNEEKGLKILAQKHE